MESAQSRWVGLGTAFVVGLFLGLLLGIRPSKALLPSPTPVSGTVPDAGAEILRQALADEREHVAQLQKELGDQEARVQGLQALAELSKDPGTKRQGPYDWDLSDPEPEWKQEYRKRLEKTVHFRFPGISFREALAYLEIEGRVVINVTKDACDADPKLFDAPIVLESPEEGMSLTSALSLLARHAGLAWTLRDETIQFTTEEDLAEPAELRQFDIRPILEAGKVGIPDSKIAEYLKEYVDKSLWENLENSIRYMNGRLLVTAPPRTQQKVREVLKGMFEKGWSP